LCDAYQNVIEYAVSAGGWVEPIDPETAWGAKYILNWNFYKTGYPEPDAFDGGPYDYGDKCMYDNVMWESQTNGNTNTPNITDGTWAIYARNGATIATTTPPPDQTITRCSPAGDEFWGCNASAFELLLWMSGDYDWYFDTTHKYLQEDIAVLRAQLGDTTPPTDPADIDTLYPVGAGRWRRT